jgi:hypothetical protein
MIKKALLSVLGLAAAVALPAAFFTASDQWKKLSLGITSKPSAGQTAPAGPLDANQVAAGQPAGVEGPPIQNLSDVLRFDVTPQWIMGRWPRVSTGLAHLQLQGYRVPLVTGTSQSDLAGALTYYFDSQQQLQRITFRGATGDARGLVATVTSRYQLTRRITNDPSMYVYESVQPNGQPASALRIRSAAIIKASEPQRRFDVELVLQRPEGS